MPNAVKEELRDFILAEWQRDVPQAVNIASKKISDRYGDVVCGVLFYGSCLRTGEIHDKIIDFYVIVDSYSSAYQSRLLAVSNKILPPNVFYHEMQIDGITVRSKYAVLSVSDLKRRTSIKCLNASVWARFCQPCMLLHSRSEEDTKQVAGYVAAAVTTMLGNLLSLKPEAKVSGQVWEAAFEETYASELRSERRGKGLEIYLLDQGRYDSLTPLVLAVLEPRTTCRTMLKLVWALRRWNGKVVSFMRLMKASMTFDGGIDYLAWKIRRHSGVEIEISNWMRRYPIMAGIVLFWRIRKKGGFK